MAQGRRAILNERSQMSCTARDGPPGPGDEAAYTARCVWIGSAPGVPGCPGALPVERANGAVLDSIPDPPGVADTLPLDPLPWVDVVAVPMKRFCSPRENAGPFVRQHSPIRVRPLTRQARQKGNKQAWTGSSSCSGSSLTERQRRRTFPHRPVDTLRRGVFVRLTYSAALCAVSAGAM